MSAQIPLSVPKVLWASPYCLLDTTSGAAVAVRSMLRQLVTRGFAVTIFSATCFDNPAGITGLGEQQERVRALAGRLLTVVDGPLNHELLVTEQLQRKAMTAMEEGLWYERYEALLVSVQPDIILLYGGQVLDLLVMAEAKRRGIRVAFYLANGSYTEGCRWFRDIDCLLTNTAANARYYRQALGIDAIPLGAFVERERFLAPAHTRQTLLFVNPCLEKGAGVVVQLALMLEERRPDVRLEVVDSRGCWQAELGRVTQALGRPRSALANVSITETTSDMRPVYGRARLLLAPSLWWEAMGRVVVEALWNGIPVVVTDRGGLPELIGDAGVAIRLDASFYQSPYLLVPSQAALMPVFDLILRVYDDACFYGEWSERAFRVAHQRHRIEDAADRLVEALNSLLAQASCEGGGVL